MFGQQFDLFLIAKQQPFPDFQLHSFEQLNKLTGSSSSSQNLKRTGVVCALCSYSKHRRGCGVSEHTCLHTAYNAVHLILGKVWHGRLEKEYCQRRVSCSPSRSFHCGAIPSWFHLLGPGAASQESRQPQMHANTGKSFDLFAMHWSLLPPTSQLSQSTFPFEL